MLGRYMFKKKHVPNTKYIDPGPYKARFKNQKGKDRFDSEKYTSSESFNRHSRFASDDMAPRKEGKDATCRGESDNEAACGSKEEDMIVSKDKDFEFDFSDVDEPCESLPDEMDVVC